MTKQPPIISGRAPVPVGPYPHARWAGDFLFVSGIGPRQTGTGQVPGNQTDAAGNVIAYDFAAQCRSVFANIRAIVEDAGANWEDIIDVTAFLTSIRDDFATFNRHYAEAFATNQPTRTTVEVRALPTPIAIELKVVVYCPGRK